MKKFARIIALVMAVALMATLFASCKKEDNVLKMGTNAAFPPYEYYEGDKIVGIDAEIGALIAKKLDMELEIVDMDFNGIIAAVQNGSIDMGMAGMTKDPDREKSVNFSTSYATGVQVVIVKEGSAIKSIDDLKGKKIGVQEATTGDSYATSDFGEEAVKRYVNGAAAVQDLQNGSIDAVIIDNEPAKAFVAANEGLTILETEYTVEEYAIAVSKDDPELLEKINKAIAELKEEGKIDEIINKYIPAE
ncbi:MAG: basic amino acid ABC transporter substrate-binding protein [Clostridia bacterium]|nr:basic amino acid ABC transporter substrate-binding protein [Clostridia bacterium]